MAPLTAHPALPAAAAREAVAAARRNAEDAEACLSFAVVDEGGNLVAFERMDGAPLASVETAINKAYTAAATRMSTRELAGLVGPGQPLYGLGSSALSPRPLVPMLGGVPLVVADWVIGGIGAAGDRPEVDDAAAAAAAATIELQPPGDQL